MVLLSNRSTVEQQGVDSRWEPSPAAWAEDDAAAGGGELCAEAEACAAAWADTAVGGGELCAEAAACAAAWADAAAGGGDTLAEAAALAAAQSIAVKVSGVLQANEALEHNSLQCM